MTNDNVAGVQLTNPDAAALLGLQIRIGEEQNQYGQFLHSHCMFHDYDRPEAVHHFIIKSDLLLTQQCSYLMCIICSDFMVYRQYK